MKKTIKQMAICAIAIATMASCEKEIVQQAEATSPATGNTVVQKSSINAVTVNLSDPDDQSYETLKSLTEQVVAGVNHLTIAWDFPKNEATITLKNYNGNAPTTAPSADRIIYHGHADITFAIYRARMLKLGLGDYNPLPCELDLDFFQFGSEWYVTDGC